MFPCLLLTPWMSIHAVTAWQRAISQVYLGEVDVLEQYGEEARSPSITIRFPAVARLNKKLKTNKSDVKFSRANVYARDRYTCQYCGVKLPANQLNYDHVLPRSKGGVTDWANIVTACLPCNHRKGNKLLKQTTMVLRKAPVKPKSLPMSSSPLVLPNMVPSLWLPYLNDRLASHIK